jgi:hypothetical protein
MKRVLVSCLAPLALAACGKESSSTSSKPAPADQAAEPPAGAPPVKMTLKSAKVGRPSGPAVERPQAGLTVTVDGAAVPMTSAVAWKHADGSVRLLVSSAPLVCADVTGDMRVLRDGEVSFQLTAGQALQPDGSRAGQLRSMYFDGMTRQRPAPAALTGDGADGQPTTLAVDFEIKGVEMGADRPARTLVAKGTVDALGCPAPASKAPPLPPPMDATLEIAGYKLPIRGARYELRGGWRSLELTTGSESCERKGGEVPGELGLQMTWFKEGPEVSQIDVTGTLLAQAGDQTFDKAKVTVSPNPGGPGELTLAADVTIGGYPVKLAGKVNAVVCPP